MQTTARCITLRVTRFKDTRTIVSCLVQHFGRLSFIVSDGAGREATRRRAVMMMPGSIFEAEVDVRDNRSLQTLSDISPVCPMLIDNPVKTTVILFICDFLNAIVRDNQPDDTLFDFVAQTITDIVTPPVTRTSSLVPSASQSSFVTCHSSLVTSASPSSFVTCHSSLVPSSIPERALANSAICFLIRLQAFMGIEPDIETYLPGSIFDMTDGIFRLTPSPFSRNLTPDQSALIPTLMRMNRRNAHLFRMTRAQRSELLTLLIDYYSLHFGNLRNLPTLTVLPTLFT